MPEDAVTNAITKINDRLKKASIRVRVWRNGNSLALRATLPKKAGQGTGTKQQDISLGIPTSRDGLRRIEIEAQKLGGLLALGTFDWSLYLPEEKRPDRMPVAELVEKFKEKYLRENRILETTWNAGWGATFRRLPQNEPLSEDSILAVALGLERNTDSRKRACQRLQALANYADIKIDLGSHKGDYGFQSIKTRDVPSDELIIEWRDLIPNQGWQWVYGVMATFGLRPHEAFLCEFVDPLTLKVKDGTKTGSRITRAILPEWSERWNLIEVCRPIIKAAIPSDYGSRNKRQFQRYFVPFPAYNLRHAYAIRGSVVKGLPVSTMASMMGHSAQIHQQIYHHWLSDSVNESVYRKLILGEDS